MSQPAFEIGPVLTLARSRAPKTDASWGSLGQGKLQTILTVGFSGRRV